jgi:hypothetical protein
MIRSLGARLAKLEHAARDERVFVVQGRTAEEHEAQIEALKASGEACESDLFICLMQFADE